MRAEQRLVIISNRVPASPTLVPPERRGSGPVGGLVNAIRPVLEQQHAVWLGWSGRSTDRRPSTVPSVTNIGSVQLATLDLSEEEANQYYSGFSNRTMWPLLHSFPERVVIRRNTYASYRRINHRFAGALFSLLQPDDLVWVHDYHLFHVGEELRRLGWTGRIGFFLHVPFPSADIFTILPWAHDFLKGLMEYDLVGFHTKRHLSNAIDTLQTELGCTSEGGRVVLGDTSVRVGAYPIGIDPTPFQQSPRRSRHTSSVQRLVLGVDRLDYTKGIPERLRAFERLLERNPSLRGKVNYIQISSPSRTRVPEYIREKEKVERLVGRINGRFSGEGWMPIRYLYRSYQPSELARFYHDADVCLVTPLRDGMNLISKEFVASQSEDDPGVLVLSRFCGAAESMREALIVNPYDTDGTSMAIHRALRMNKLERRQRWRTLMNTVCTQTAMNWGTTFLHDLAAA